MTADEKARRERRLTVQQFGEAWTSGKLYERHGDVNGLRQKKSASNDAHRLAAYVYPLIGAKPVAEVAEEDIERILASAERNARRRLGRPWRKAARLQLYQLLRRLFVLAIRPGRLRANSPVSESLRPGRDDPKLFGFLNPSELLALLKCKKVPIERRVLYAPRRLYGAAQGLALRAALERIDFQHRRLTSLHSKTGLPQLFEVPATLGDLLAAWHAHQARPPAPSRSRASRRASARRGCCATTWSRRRSIGPRCSARAATTCRRSASTTCGRRSSRGRCGRGAATAGSATARGT